MNHRQYRFVHLLLFILLTHSSALSSHLPPSTSRVFIPPTPSPIEPYPWLHGGSFTSPPIPYHPDPLATYEWQPGVNASQLQLFCLLPLSVSLASDTEASSILNAQSLLAQASNVTFTSQGAIELDFGLNSAAWIEFDSPDLAPNDAANFLLSISEYNKYEITNLGAKIGQATPYKSSESVTTYRLEIPHPDGSGENELCIRTRITIQTKREKAAHAIIMNAIISNFRITALRLVCQVKPQNWAGKFAAAGDDKLSRIWYLGAYTVKVNLLADQFGSILIYRGDRFSWTGDAHVAQATAMAAFGNFDFVKQNLFFTKDNCNGIESYCLYFVLSVADYFFATNDSQTAHQLSYAYVAPKLERAHSLLQQDSIKLGFFGWDDRLGSGFSNSSSEEAQRCYRFLAISTFQTWANVCRNLGNETEAAHYEQYAAAAISQARNRPNFLFDLGIHSAAEAIIGGWLAANETDFLLKTLFDDLTTVCSLSGFNTYFILRALAAAGDLDRGLAVIHACWDVMVDLGATTSWETSKPVWSQLLNVNDGVPAFQDGFTSLAHPWSSGPTQWLSQHIVGFVPVADDSWASGGGWVVQPFIGRDMRGVKGSQRLPDGSVLSVGVSATSSDYKENEIAGDGVALIVLNVVGTTDVQLRISEVLAARMLRFKDDRVHKEREVYISSDILKERHNCDVVIGQMNDLPATSSNTMNWTPLSQRTKLRFDSDSKGPMVSDSSSSRCDIATIPLPAGECIRFKLTFNEPTETKLQYSNKRFDPFPVPTYPSYFLGVDRTTGGNWIGTYGSSGYYLAAFDGTDKHRFNFPDWVVGVNQNFGPGYNNLWTSPPAANDSRALQVRQPMCIDISFEPPHLSVRAMTVIQDPKDPLGARKIGWFAAVPPPAPGWAPSFPLDVEVDLSTVPANLTLQFAFYFVDWDFGGRKQSVQLMDRENLSDISPVQILHSFEGGAWLVWQYRGGVRMRVNYMRGTNQVISAVLFDLVQL